MDAGTVGHAGADSDGHACSLANVDACTNTATGHAVKLNRQEIVLR